MMLTLSTHVQELKASLNSETTKWCSPLSNDNPSLPVCSGN